MFLVMSRFMRLLRIFLTIQATVKTLAQVNSRIHPSVEQTERNLNKYEDPLKAVGIVRQIFVQSCENGEGFPSTLFPNFAAPLAGTFSRHCMDGNFVKNILSPFSH